VVPTHGLSPNLFSKESGTSDTGPGRIGVGNRIGVPSILICLIGSALLGFRGYWS